MDTFGHIYSNQAFQASHPPGIFVFFDIAAAFPTLAVQWLFLVLKAVGTPTGFRRYASAMYVELLHYIQYKGAYTLMGNVTRGVVQGCPLASLLYILAAHPFSLMCQESICKVQK
eukprot:2646896-Karenia_brevis.AAC.1